MGIGMHCMPFRCTGMGEYSVTATTWVGAAATLYCVLGRGYAGGVAWCWLQERQKAAQGMCGFSELAPRAGLEPATCGLTVRRSTN